MRRRGFTLIELLVVIAIIGILAAMLFPVFARARESARKTQCLANVKNIALAVNMYLADYDRMPPHETRREVNDWYADGGGKPGEGTCDFVATDANPYLRFPVVLDDYVKNRQVWRCPSAKAEFMPPILFDAGRDWFAVATQSWTDTGEMGLLQCSKPFPSGWGGAVTDSWRQGWAISDPSTGGVAISIYGFQSNYGLSLSSVGDAARWLTVTEVGAGLDAWATFNLAYPDICKAGCSTTNPTPIDPSADPCPSQAPDWVNCSDTTSCSADPQRFGADSTYRKTFTRHLGGTNLGFLDGHAKWYPGEAILMGGQDWRPGARTKPTTELLFENEIGICYMPDLR